MHTNTIRARVNGYGLYHLTMALLLGITIGVLLTLSIFITAPANAAEALPERVTVVHVSGNQGSHGYDTMRVIFAQRVGVNRRSLFFTTNDGTDWVATRCVAEDDRNCWWDAARRGNHRGHGVVKIGNHDLPVPASVIR